jgi:hypothetical protein
MVQKVFPMMLLIYYYFLLVCELWILYIKYLKMALEKRKGLELD